MIQKNTYGIEGAPFTDLLWSGAKRPFSNIQESHIYSTDSWLLCLCRWAAVVGVCLCLCLLECVNAAETAATRDIHSPFHTHSGATNPYTAYKVNNYGNWNGWYCTVPYLAGYL